MTATKHITAPPNWKPNNPEAIARWMRRLPNVYDLEKAKEIDRKYEELKVFVTKNNNLI